MEADLSLVEFSVTPAASARVVQFLDISAVFSDAALLDFREALESESSRVCWLFPVYDISTNSSECILTMSSVYFLYKLYLIVA